MKDPEERLPVGLRSRAEALIEIILKYSYEILTRTEYSSPPPHLVNPASYESSRDLYCVMLLNDEIHTYEQVRLGSFKLLFCTAPVGVCCLQRLWLRVMQAPAADIYFYSSLFTTC